MSAPLLSICIPTYNRANELRTCLESICDQTDKDPNLAERIEIVISDNASADDTTSVVRELQKTYPFIRYTRNDTNLGFDRNVLNVVANARGEYCLTLGDDDGIMEGGLAAIFDTIATTKSSYINLNSWGYNHALTAPLVPRPNRRQMNDATYATLRDFATTVTDPMQLVGTFGGMSAQLFQRQLWNDYSDKEKFIGTQTVHLFVIVNAFKDRQSTLMKEPTIMTRSDNIRWDSVPGFETETKRTRKTIEAALWMIHFYKLPMSPLKIHAKLTTRAIMNVVKGLVKKTLYRAGWRRGKAM